MRCQIFFAALFAMILAAATVSVPAAHAQRPTKDYLTETEADQIRDAVTPPEKLKLFTTFAEDRLKKFQYELAREKPEGRRSEILNGLLNAYIGCLDDAADQIALAQEKQIDIHGPLKTLDMKAKVFLDTLQAVDKKGPEYSIFQDNLQDAIEGTKDAIDDTEKALKELAPAPMRRKVN
jgi:hypothetical protein